MALTDPLLKIRRDRFEVRQGDGYVTIDRIRVEAVHVHGNVLTVRYRERGQVELDCSQMALADLQGLLHALEVQRDRNHQLAREQVRRKSLPILPGIFP